MGLLQRFRSRKYLLRILLSITLLMVAGLCLSAAVLQYNAEKRAVEMQNEANRKVLQQINHNVAYMQEIVKNLALSIWNDEQIFFTLGSGDRQPELDVINAKRLLGKAQDSAAFLHSILVYNGSRNEIYAQGDMADNLQDHALAEAVAGKLRSSVKLPQLQLLPMRADASGASVSFFSMILYETFKERNEQESALAVNVKPEWIFDNLKVVNNLGTQGQAAILILDGDGLLLPYGTERDLPELAGLQERVAAHQALGGASSGFFAEAFGGSGKWLVSYMDMGVAGWKVVAVQPYRSVLGAVYQMRTAALVIVSCFLVLFVTASILLGYRLYRPVEQMVAGIRSGAEAARAPLPGGGNELASVATSYKELARRFTDVTLAQDKQRDILYNYHLRSLITASVSYSPAQFQDTLRENGFNIAPEGQFLLTVIKWAADAAPLAQPASAIAALTGEILLRSRYRHVAADMKSDHLVVLLSAESGGISIPEVTVLLEELQELAERNNRLTLAVSTGEVIAGYRQLTEQYGLALQLSMYKLVLGKRAVITPERVKQNRERQDYSFPAEQGKKLSEAIRCNDLPAMLAAVHLIICQLAVYSYDHILLGILQTVDLIKTTIREINRNRVVSAAVDMSSLSRQALNKESLVEIEQLLQQVCRDIHGQLQHTPEQKNGVLAEAIKEIVAESYSDSNLSLQAIADMLQLTPAYVGRIFKNQELLSVGEYINEVRLTRARICLETESLGVKEIMERTGYMNQSTFFKLFKKKYGVTPKEYRLKSNIG